MRKCKSPLLKTFYPRV